MSHEWENVFSDLYKKCIICELYRNEYLNSENHITYNYYTGSKFNLTIEYEELTFEELIIRNILE